MKARDHIGTKLHAGISNCRQFGSDSLCVVRRQLLWTSPIAPPSRTQDSAKFTYSSEISFELKSTQALLLAFRNLESPRLLTIVRLRSSLLGASSSVHRNGPLQSPAAAARGWPSRPCATGWRTTNAAAVLLEGLHEGFAVEGLQAHASAGNGIEFRGGSANCYYCAASEAGGTGLAWGRGLDRDRRQEARKVSAPYPEGS